MATDNIARALVAQIGNIINPDYIILNSSTPGSTKKFKITVNDSGVISAQEI